MNKVIWAALALGTMALVATADTKTPVKGIFQEQANGDYRLYLYGADRALVCEEKDITITQQGDAINPVVIECKH